MTFSLTPGYTFQTNEVLDADSLNALLGDAQANGLLSSNLATGYALVETQATAPGASLGRPWLDFSHTLALSHGAILRFGDGATFAFGDGVVALTYTGTIPTISAGRVVDLVPGDRVVLCGTSSTVTTDGRVFAVSLTPTLNTGEKGLFMYRGICQMRIDAIDLNPGYVGSRLEGSYLYARGTVSPGNALLIAPPPVLPGENMSLFAVLLESFTSNTFTAGNFYVKVLK
jgi:hypothetical protein